MKKLNPVVFTTAFLAGVSLLAMPVMAQDAQDNKLPRPVQGDQAPSGGAEGSGSAQGGAATGSDAASPGASSEGGADAQSTSPGSSGAESSGGSASDAPASGGGEAGQQPNDNSASEAAPGQMQNSGEAGSATEAAPGQQQKSGEPGDAQQAAPGQVKKSDEGSTNVEISSEQQVEIRKVITEVDVEPVTTEVNVNIGVEVPRTIELRPLPPKIVEIVPAYEGYEFFLLPDGRIVIVEPDTLKVVYILVS